MKNAAFSLFLFFLQNQYHSTFYVVTSGGAASVGPKETMPTNPNAGHGGGGFNMTDRRPSSANYGASQMVSNVRHLALCVCVCLLCVCVCVRVLVITTGAV